MMLRKYAWIALLGGLHVTWLGGIAVLAALSMAYDAATNLQGAERQLFVLVAVRMFLAYGLGLATGLAGLVVSRGLFTARPWARRAWLLLITWYVCHTGVWAVYLSVYGKGALGHWLEALASLAIAGYSWMELGSGGDGKESPVTPPAATERPGTAVTPSTTEPEGGAAVRSVALEDRMDRIKRRG